MGDLIRTGYAVEDFQSGDRVIFAANHPAAIEIGISGRTGTVGEHPHDHALNGVTVWVKFDKPINSGAIEMACAPEYLRPHHVDVDTSDLAAIENYLNT